MTAARLNFAWFQSHFADTFRWSFDEHASRRRAQCRACLLCRSAYPFPWFNPTHGVLLAFDEASLRLAMASDNAAVLLGPQAALLGRTVDEILRASGRLVRDAIGADLLEANPAPRDQAKPRGVRLRLATGAGCGVSKSLGNSSSML